MQGKALNTVERAEIIKRIRNGDTLSTISAQMMVSKNTICRINREFKSTGGEFIISPAQFIELALENGYKNAAEFIEMLVEETES